MHRQELLSLLNSYHTPYMEEAGMAEKTRLFVLQHENCFDRNLSIGHVSGSAWVVNPARTHVLLLHHRKLNMWLQPGGHADGDPDILRVILNETAEETGISLEHINLLGESIFDIDVHTVHESIHDSRHTHFDVRFLVEIDDSLPIPGNYESHQIAWVPLEQVCYFNNALSLHRLVRKTKQLVRPSIASLKFAEGTSDYVI